MWEISNLGQGNAIIYAFLLGQVLGFIYDIFKLDRIIFKRSTVTVAFEDILFWLIAAFLTFCLLLLTSNGQVRLYIIATIFLSFFIYYFTFSRLVLILAPFLKKASRKISKLYLKGVDFLSKTDFIILSQIKRLKKHLFKGQKWQKKIKNNVKNTCNQD